LIEQIGDNLMLVYDSQNLPTPEEFRKALREASEQYDPVEELLRLRHELDDLERPLLGRARDHANDWRPLWLDESRCTRMQLAAKGRVIWQALADLKRLLEEAQPATALDECSLPGRDGEHETTKPPSSDGTGIGSSDAARLEATADGVPGRARAVTRARHQGARPTRPRRGTRRGGRS
jgi:hypothetical protein